MEQRTEQKRWKATGQNQSAPSRRHTGCISAMEPPGAATHNPSKPKTITAGRSVDSHPKEATTYITPPPVPIAACRSTLRSTTWYASPRLEPCVKFSASNCPLRKSVAVDHGRRGTRRGRSSNGRIYFFYESNFTLYRDLAGAGQGGRAARGRRLPGLPLVRMGVTKQFIDMQCTAFHSFATDPALT